jgi:hypothetical protein
MIVLELLWLKLKWKVLGSGSFTTYFSSLPLSQNLEVTIEHISAIGSYHHWREQTWT